MKDCIKQLPLDRAKRHFVLGDAHGRYDTFLELLKMIDYNEETDIIYSVGDIIDRGPKSFELLQFFDRDNTYAIRGNHEYMAITMEWMEVWLNNGGVQCLYSLGENDVDIDWLHTYIKELPWFIDVGEADEEGSFRLIHAELPLAWSEEDFQSIIADAPDGEDHNFQPLLWARSAIMDAVRNTVHLRPAAQGAVVNPNRSGRQVFCGHTPTERPIRIGDMMYIDTFRTYTLTLVNALTLETFTHKVID